MKLACVVQRYGAAVAGGSEAHCREVAERLAARHEVTVLTTCAADYVTWRNALPAGVSTEARVEVHRFPVRVPRDLAQFAAISDEVFDGATDPARQHAWFEANGPVSPALIEHLRRESARYDLVIFWTFRYAPSFFGLPLVADRSVIVPTAEDDPAVRLDVLEAWFALPAAYVFLTPEEEVLVSRRARRTLGPSTTIGMGLTPVEPGAAPGEVLAPLQVPASYFLYLGRVDRNKGCDTLIEYFTRYADEDPSARLVLAGPSTIPIPAHPSIHALGYVSNEVREALFSRATALLIPSPYESLSIVLLEGWNHAVPAVVNARCAVLDGQVRRANGGLPYRSYEEFRECLNYLRTHERERQAFGRQGLAYVDREYRWPTVMAKVERLLGEAIAVRDGRLAAAGR